MEKYTELPLEIDAERLMQFPAGRYLAVDMRDEYSCGYGSRQAAIWQWICGTSIPAATECWTEL